MQGRELGKLPPKKPEAEEQYKKIKRNLSSLRNMMVVLNESFLKGDNNVLDQLNANLVALDNFEANTSVGLVKSLAEIGERNKEDSERSSNIAYSQATVKLIAAYNDFVKDPTFLSYVIDRYEQLSLNFSAKKMEGAVSEYIGLQHQLAALELKGQADIDIRKISSELNNAGKKIEKLNDRIIGLCNLLSISLPAIEGRLQISENKISSILNHVGGVEVGLIGKYIQQRNVFEYNSFLKHPGESVTPSPEIQSLDKELEVLKTDILMLYDKIEEYYKQMKQYSVQIRQSNPSHFVIKAKQNKQGEIVYNINPDINRAILIAYRNALIKYFEATKGKEIERKFGLLKHNDQPLFNLDDESITIHDPIFNLMQEGMSTAKLIRTINETFALIANDRNAVEILEKELNSNLAIEREFKIIQRVDDRIYELKCLDPELLIGPKRTATSMDTLLSSAAKIKMLPQLEQPFADKEALVAKVVEKMIPHAEAALKDIQKELESQVAANSRHILRNKRWLTPSHKHSLFKKTPSWVTKIIDLLQADKKSRMSNKDFLAALRKIVGDKKVPKSATPAVMQFFSLILESDKINSGTTLSDIEILKKQVVDEIETLAKKLQLQTEDFQPISEPLDPQILKETKLSEAVKKGVFDEVRTVLETGANINEIFATENGKSTALSLAVRENKLDNKLDIAKFLVERNANVNIPTPSATEIAAAAGNLAMMKAIYKPARIEPENAVNTMHAAIENGRIHVVTFLSENGVDLNKPINKIGWTFLLTAIEKRDFPIVEYLVKHGAKVNQASVNGIDPFKLAMEVKDERIINFIVDAKANVLLEDEFVHIQAPNPKP